MSLKHLIFGLLTIALMSCKNDGKYEPEGLRQLTEKELLDKAEKRQTYNYENVVYKNEKGIEISLDSFQKISNVEEWAADSYVNERNEVVELVLRKAIANDKEFQQKLKETYEKEIVEPIIQIDIDCRNIQNTLTKVHALDQDMRMNGNGIDQNVDRENLVKVVSLIEKCGLPTLNDVNQEQMTAIWLVFQHADNFHRKKYFPMLKQSAKNGDIIQSHIALMEDRILMFDKKPQIYGSQITENRENGKWMIYDLQNPESVDKRRAEVGLGPLSEYVSQWDIKFNIEQAE